jgi:hypothetical protein
MSATTTTTSRRTIDIEIQDLQDEVDCASDARDAVAECSCSACLKEWRKLSHEIIEMRGFIHDRRQALLDMPI